VKTLDLFSGIGGFAVGLHREGYETVAFCENDEYCRKVLAKNYPEVKIYNDVCDVSREQLESDGITGIRLIVGGFPCQPFSRVGSRKGTEDHRSLWHEMHRIVEEIRPDWVIAENVVGIVEMELDTVLTDLEGIRYETATFDIPAASVGANHERRRIFIVGCHADHLADADSTGLQGWDSGTFAQRESTTGYLGQSHRWVPPPRICRRSDGVPNRIHRLRAIGNSVVPDIAQQFGRVISDIEQHYSRV
jgi:DNA (cytosine-5)-methyltransferase 1